MCKLNVVDVVLKRDRSIHSRAVRILSVADVEELKRFLNVTFSASWEIETLIESLTFGLGDWIICDELDNVLISPSKKNVSVYPNDLFDQSFEILHMPVDEANMQLGSCKDIEAVRQAERFVKKPVEIEALQFAGTAENTLELSEFIGKDITIDYANPQAPVLKIETLEGTMSASVGDYIIKGVKGEFYPCKPDIFEVTYTKVEKLIYSIVENPLLTRKYTFIEFADGKNSKTPTIFSISDTHTGAVLTKIVFQDGAIKECGVNGVQNEDLIGCVLARLQAFQNGEFKCRENALAITKLEEALLWLRARTTAREQRGVEGTNTK